MARQIIFGEIPGIEEGRLFKGSYTNSYKTKFTKNKNI